jgi:hypothetical protein
MLKCEIEFKNRKTIHSVTKNCYQALLLMKLRLFNAIRLKNYKICIIKVQMKKLLWTRGKLCKLKINLKET